MTGIRPLLAARLALRGLIRDPSSSLTAILVLALGFAAPVTFASLLVGAMRPLPVPEGDRVARVDAVLPTADGRAVPITGRDLEAWHEARSVEAVGGFRTVGATLVDPEVAATRVPAAALTPSVLPMLGVAPALGRLPAADEADRGFILGHEVWTELFEADPGVIGREIEVDGTPRVVTAVMPEGFGFPFSQSAWWIEPVRPTGSATWDGVARLADDASWESASAELGLLWARLDDERDAAETGGVVQVRDFTSGRGEGGEAVAFGGLVLVGVCLLLIACANVANLLLVRASERVRALGVQAAIGAGRAQLALQLLTEALLLALAGGAAGLLVADVVVSWVQATSTENFGYHWMRMAVDGTVVVFTAGLVSLTALVAGSLPVRRVMRLDVQSVLKGGAGGDAFGGGGRIARGFVTGQLALSCAALMAATLTVGAMLDAREFGGSLPAGEVLLARIHLGGSPHPAVTRDALLAEASARPGVRAAALAIGAPGGYEPFGPLEVEGVVYERAGERPYLQANAVTPGYFTLFDLALLRGRAVTASDVRGTEPVAVVNESFARLFAADGEVIGRRYRLPELDSAWATVVGVVEDARLGEGPQVRHERLYLALAQVERDAPMMLLRADGPAGELAPTLRRVVASVNPGLAVTEVRTLESLHDFMTRAQSVLSSLGAGGGFAALIVAAMGLYGLLAFRVRQRRRELGIRLALDADGRRLAREVLGVALRQLLPATAVGLALAWLVAPVLGMILLGGDPRDPLAYAGVAGAFLAVGAVAALIPALRAAATDPARVLQAE